jgi:hypothetical protein
MSISSALTLNIILDLVALTPILLLARWAISTSRQDIRRVEARRRYFARRLSGGAQPESA